MNKQQLMVDDLLDFVDKMLEVLGRKTSAASGSCSNAAVDVRVLDNMLYHVSGPGPSLVRTISCLEAIQMEEQAAELRSKCSRGGRTPSS